MCYYSIFCLSLLKFFAKADVLMTIVTKAADEAKITLYVRSDHCIAFRRFCEFVYDGIYIPIISNECQTVKNQFM